MVAQVEAFNGSFRNVLEHKSRVLLRDLLRNRCGGNDRLRLVNSMELLGNDRLRCVHSWVLVLDDELRSVHSLVLVGNDRLRLVSGMMLVGNHRLRLVSSMMLVGGMDLVSNNRLRLMRLLMDVHSLWNMDRLGDGNRSRCVDDRLRVVGTSDTLGMLVTFLKVVRDSLAALFIAPSKAASQRARNIAIAITDLWKFGHVKVRLDRVHNHGADTLMGGCSKDRTRCGCGRFVERGDV